MAALDELVAQIPNRALRERLLKVVGDLRKRRKFGLVFEEHIPETTAIYGLPIQVGALVQRRQDAEGKSLFKVARVGQGGKQVVITKPDVDGFQETVAAKDLLVVKRFGEPMYAGLTPVSTVRRGPKDRPHHAVIKGENFHALQLFTYLYDHSVDCIYIDPPFNTGARDWKYNNRYVDKNDSWRHSKWLSMMEKRLRLCRRLLKSDGVLVVMIDSNEVHHLGMLLEDLFPDALRQIVSICINPSGSSGEGLSRVDEYAVFCFLGNAEPVTNTDDMLSTSSSPRLSVRWEALMRGGAGWYRSIRKNLCYPVLLDDKGEKIVGVGPPLADDVADADRPTTINGHRAAWPVRDDRRLGIWRVDGAWLTELASKGYAYVSSEDKDRGTWTIRYLLQGTIDAIERGDIKPSGFGPRGQVLVRLPEPKRVLAKTIWNRGRHTAGGAGGSIMLVNLLGERGAFPFPKSVYAVRDCLEVAIGNKKDALILDFFAGSGTTMHAVALMNADDGGTRRTVMVTNNEVSEEQARAMRKRGLFPGDQEYEAQGIFEHVTKPRVTAAITGVRPDGAPVEGAYLDGRQYSEGLDENAEFYELHYLDPDEVELGEQFKAIHPLLWLSAGGTGKRETVAYPRDFYIAPASSYGVLFKSSRLKKFLMALENRPDVTHVWVVTDSQEAYAEACEALPAHVVHTSQLYHDYLRTFRINRRHV